MTKLPDILEDRAVRELIRSALEEDIGPGDATTQALVDPVVNVAAAIVAREACRVSGGDVGIAVLRMLSPDVTADVRIADGATARAGDVVVAIRGPARAILTGERTALNFMQRMSGIATLTARFVKLVEPYGTLILDTRKTGPGLRAVEKYAVLCGGGSNHRMGLYDRIMIKDNHRRLCRAEGRIGLAEAVRRVRDAFPALMVEVEVESEEELADALRAGPDWVLLDNMESGRLRRFVDLCKGRVRTEASGGITLDNAAAVAASGVDAISLGCLTHSAPAVDLSLEIESVAAAL